MQRTDSGHHGNTPPHEDLFHLLRHGSVETVYLRCRPGPFAVVVMSVPLLRGESEEARTPQVLNIGMQPNADLALSPVPRYIIKFSQLNSWVCRIH